MGLPLSERCARAALGRAHRETGSLPPSSHASVSWWTWRKRMSAVPIEISNVLRTFINYPRWYPRNARRRPIHGTPAGAKALPTRVRLVIPNCSTMTESACGRRSHAEFRPKWSPWRGRNQGRSSDRLWCGRRFRGPAIFPNTASGIHRLDLRDISETRLVHDDFFEHFRWKFQRRSGNFLILRRVCKVDNNQQPISIAWRIVGGL